MATALNSRGRIENHREQTCSLCGRTGLGMEAPGFSRTGRALAEHWVRRDAWRCSDLAVCGDRIRGGRPAQPFDPEYPFD
jgi:hypothetical protein